MAEVTFTPQEIATFPEGPPGPLGPPGPPLTQTDYLAVGSGDAQKMYNATAAQRLAVKKGTAASPDTNLHPLVKVERTIRIAQAAVTGDGVEQCASLVGITVGDSACESQAVGVAGFAKTSSTAEGATVAGNDACGVYGVGNVTGAGTGLGLGAFLAGRRETSTGKANGAEITVGNYSGVAGTYNSSGFSRTLGLWIHAHGNADSGCGIQFGSPFGHKWKVGIGFNSQQGGGVSDASIRDDSSSKTVLDVNGAHLDAIDLAGATISGAALKTGPAYIEGAEMSEPPVPPANCGRLFFRDAGGKTQLAVRFPTGAIQIVATEP